MTHLRSLVAVVAVIALAVPVAADEKPKTPAETILDVRLIDGSTIKMSLLDSRIEIETPAGKQSIPVSDIRKIELALRIPDDVAKQIEAAIRDLGSDQAKKRDDAKLRLIGFRERAFPALKRAAESSDEDQSTLAKSLIEKLKDIVPEERLAALDNDVIHLEKSKVAGKITSPVLKARSFAFGDLPLKLADVRSMAAKLPEDERAKAALADPGSLTAYRQPQFFGREFTFRVTGVARGSVWGTEVYTADSTLAAAAVHMGVLKVGETGLVTVTIMGPLPKFIGSTRNGVTTSAYDQYPAAYRIHPKGD